MLRGVLGFASLILIAWLCSRNRKAVAWRTVVGGVMLQILIAAAVLKVGPVRFLFEKVSDFAIAIMSFTEKGSVFLFGDLVKNTDTFGYIFAFQVLPTIVFFSALTSVLYYLNLLQWVVFGFAWVMNKTLRLSGAETLAATANIFVGQTEAPLMVKPYIDGMSRSEILALMTGGMATIAGAVLVAYIGFLGGGDPEQQKLFATHLLTASIISAPAALVAAKILLPETEEVDRTVFVPRHSMGDNLLDAIASGTTQGVKLAVNVGAMLLVFTALIAMVNYLLTHGIGGWTGLNDWVASVTDGRYPEFSLQFVLGVLLSPVAWLIGTPMEDAMRVGQLLGEKTILNEFYAYATMGELKEQGAFADPRSILIATYALCGFANFASIGIQIGGIGSLAPGRRKDLSELAVLSLVGGTLACLMTACVAGMLV